MQVLGFVGMQPPNEMPPIPPRRSEGKKRKTKGELTWLHP